MRVVYRLMLLLLLSAHGMANAAQFAFSYTFDNINDLTNVRTLNGIFEGTANGDLITFTKLDYINAGGYIFNNIAASGLTSFSGNTQSFSMEGYDENPAFIFDFSASATPGQSSTSNITFVGVERFGYWAAASDTPINASWSVTALAAAVPEPDAYLMLAAGLGAIGVLMRKKKAAQ